MIIPVKKFLFIGVQEDLDKFFFRAQQQGNLEFISPSGKKLVEHTPEVHALLGALKVLRKVPIKEIYKGPRTVPLALEVAARILTLQSNIEKCFEERRLLEVEISRVAPFGDFSMQDIAFIEREGKKKVQFFCMKTAKSHQTNFGDEVIYISTEYDLDYFIAVNPTARSYPDMIEMHVHHSASELREDLSGVVTALHDFEAELKAFAGYTEFLHEALLEELNHFNLKIAKKEVSHPLEGSLFSVEAWLPETKTASLFSLVDSMAVHCEEVSIDPNDRVPTYMANAGMHRAGEDLVKIYDVPATTDKDPSGWVLWAFILFFAMIVADAGYGAVYLAVAVYLNYKFPKLKGQGKRIFKLFVVLSIGCVVWGVITSAYFGLRMSPENKFSKYSLIHYMVEKKADYHLEAHDDVYTHWMTEHPGLPNKNGNEMIAGATSMKGTRKVYDMFGEFSNNILLELALLVGVIHISCSLMRNFFRNWAALGWTAFLIGGYLYFPSMLNATSLVNFVGGVDKKHAAAIGLQLLEGGLVFAVVAALIQKRWKGLGEILTSIQVFADALSYLRLYALALASTIMAETFNDMGVGVGLVAGALVVIMGHAINITLATMGGVIHGLRLNFLEWYHYSFEGGGRIFKPLKRLKLD
jgi:V/A-type H+-transporting ATPase subunit I